jgi:hypothetical protein
MRATVVLNLLAGVLLATGGTAARATESGVPGNASSPNFGDEVAFLRKRTDIILLQSNDGGAQVAISPAWQGRVMTSTAQGSAGRGFGWINRELIASGQLAEHINVYGGEDRLWLGPEGGQFALYFAPGVPFDLAHWYVPKPLDVLPFKLEHRTSDRAQLSSAFELVNYAGTHFKVRLERTVRVLPLAEAWKRLEIGALDGVSVVAYESNNTLTNTGNQSWTKSAGLLSIWILGMYPPSARTTIVAPLRPATPAGDTGVTSDYFGPIPQKRLALTDRAVFLSGDGQFRSKIGIAPQRALGRVGSYDAEHHVLTIVQTHDPADITEYVNSAWRIQDRPYAGDSINAYNDGPATPGGKALGPFYELETSSPAAALPPGGRIEHTHRTFHLIGSEQSLNRVAQHVLGVSLEEIQAAVHGG